jgi:hypothetical protein
MATATMPANVVNARFDLMDVAARMSAGISSAVEAAVPPGTPFRRQLGHDLHLRLNTARGLDRVMARLEQFAAEEQKQNTARRAEWRRQYRREQLAKSPAHKLAGIERRLKAAGVRIDRSDRSETRYAGDHGCHLRISTHELGWADYGSREQVHHGPEVVVSVDDSPADILTQCIAAVREFGRDMPRSDVVQRMDRRDAAALLRGLRLALRRARKAAGVTQ